MGFFRRLLWPRPEICAAANPVFVPAPPPRPPHGGTASRVEPARSRSSERNAGRQNSGRQTAGRIAPGEAFTPTQPKSGRRRLVGREAELRRILQALQEDRAHVVLYSERGRGKTSLANLVVELLRRSGSIVARCTCEAGTTFDSLMRGLMHDLPPSLLAGRPGRGNEGRDASQFDLGRPADVGGYETHDLDGCGAALPQGELRPRDVVALPQRLNCRDLVCVVDEFDRVEDPATRTRLADTIKQLSDRDVRLLFLIVGVSENLDQILGQHPSIQRAVVGVHLSLFSDRDVAQLIARGARETGLDFHPAVIARVTVLARGMPYMAQLLCLRLTQAATDRDDTSVTEDDFDAAVLRLIEDASPRVLALYDHLTTHGQDGEMVQALRRVATAPQDSWGRLTVFAAVDGSVLVGERAISFSCWERLEAAQVLQPALSAAAAGSGLYVFAERALLHHVLLLAARDAALPAARPNDATPADAVIEAYPSSEQEVRQPLARQSWVPQPQSPDVAAPRQLRGAPSMSRG